MSIKKYIRRKYLLDNIQNIDSILKCELLVMDRWSTNFIKDMNYDERILRNKIKEEEIYKSGCPNNNINYNKLKSLSETLISLKTNPSWLDVHFTQDKLGRFNLSIDEFGKFDILIQKSINSIISYYDNQINL